MSVVPQVDSVDSLRAFVDLGRRKDLDRVPARDIERQEATVLRALELLQQQPGVVLADEVGMGKTFEALGVAASFWKLAPSSRIVVLTPGPDLNTKWFKEVARFSDRLGENAGKYCIHDFGDDVRQVRRMSELLAALRSGARLVIAPVSGFVNDPAAQVHMLSLYCHWKGLPHQTLHAMLRRFREGAERVDVENELFLDCVPFHELEPKLDAVFGKASRKGEPDGLDALVEEHGNDALATHAAKRALDLARFRLVRELTPEIALLVVDEAHKLKNAYTARAQAVATVFRKRFSKAVFLTATPFQLDISELRQVFALFRNAKGRTDHLLDETEELFSRIREYQLSYDDFQRVWAAQDEAAAAQVARWFQEDPTLSQVPSDAATAAVASSFSALLKLKREHIEPGLRRWMIRSLREDKRQYRLKLKERRTARGGNALPFLVYERLIAELFRVRSSTHKAAVQINMVSSYGAAREGALLADEKRQREQSVEAYRQVLRAALNAETRQIADHPKLGYVADTALKHAEAGEKTLIFCTRIQTLRELSGHLGQEWEQQLLARWQALYPGASEEDIFDRRSDEQVRKGRHALLQQRFHRGSDWLYLALRERYVQSVLSLQEWPQQHVGAITEKANELLRQLRLGKTAAERLDYQAAKRCIEQATAILLRELDPERAQDYQSLLDRMCDPRFIKFGYDLEPDPLEGDHVGEHAPTWQITDAVTEVVVAWRPNLWGLLTGRVCEMPERDRIDVVERLARYLTFRQVPFIIDLLETAHAAGLNVEHLESRALLDFVDKFWLTPKGKHWLTRLGDFIDYYSREPALREGLLQAIERVAFVRHTAEGESREKLREAFNTPLFPMVLVANEVMQEGLDLHKSCRHVVHHDLAWNPAQLEQRVGRVDRLGSLTAKLRQKNADEKLSVLYPLIRNTIDDRLYRAVQAREKWLEFLLGAQPDFEEYWLGEGEIPALPEGMAEALKIDLGVR